MKSSLLFSSLVLTLSLTARAETATPVAETMPAMETPAAEMSATPTAPASDTEVSEAVLGTAISNREIVGEATTFSAAAGDVYCLSVITSKTNPTSVAHVWSMDGKETASVPLAINGPRWRTWSRKTVWPGAWTVDIKDAAGTVLKTLSLTVTP